MWTSISHGNYYFEWFWKFEYKSVWTQRMSCVWSNFGATCFCLWLWTHGLSQGMGLSGNIFIASLWPLRGTELPGPHKLCMGLTRVLTLSHVCITKKKKEREEDGRSIRHQYFFHHVSCCTWRKTHIWGPSFLYRLNILFWVAGLRDLLAAVTVLFFRESLPNVPMKKSSERSRDSVLPPTVVRKPHGVYWLC